MEEGFECGLVSLVLWMKAACLQYLLDEKEVFNFTVMSWNEFLIAGITKSYFSSILKFQ